VEPHPQPLPAAGRGDYYPPLSVAERGLGGEVCPGE